jgi:hypothetical protein
MTTLTIKASGGGGRPTVGDRMTVWLDDSGIVGAVAGRPAVDRVREAKLDGRRSKARKTTATGVTHHVPVSV